MKYIIEVLSPNPTGTRTQVYPSRESAEAALDSYNYHRPGQPIIVLYQDGNDTKALLAIGISTKKYTLVSGGDAIQNNYISNIKASNIILDSIDITGLLSENGPGCPKESGANYDLIDGASRHFGWLGTTESEDAVVYDPERGTFSTKQGLTVQQMFDAILNGKTGPGPVTTYTVQVTGDNHCIIDCDPSKYKNGVQHSAGDQLDITASVEFDEEGYYFVKWTRNGVDYSSQNNLTVNEVVQDENIIYKAKSANTYTITFINSEIESNIVRKILQYNTSIPFDDEEVISGLIDTNTEEVDHWLNADHERVENPNLEKVTESTTYYLVSKDKEVPMWRLNVIEDWTSGYNTISELKDNAVDDREEKVWKSEQCASITDDNKVGLPAGCYFVPFGKWRDDNIDTLYKGIDGHTFTFYKYDEMEHKWLDITQEFTLDEDIYKWEQEQEYDVTTIFAIKIN